MLVTHCLNWNSESFQKGRSYEVSDVALDQSWDGFFLTTSKKRNANFKDSGETGDFEETDDFQGMS